MLILSQNGRGAAEELTESATKVDATTDTAAVVAALEEGV